MDKFEKFKFKDDFKPLTFEKFMKEKYQGEVIIEKNDGYYAMAPTDEEK